MFETLLIALVLIIVVTLLLGLLIHIITKVVNTSLESELHKESMHHRRNKTNHRSDILSDLEQISINKLKADIECLYEINRNVNVTVGECLDKFENGKNAIVTNGKCIGFTL